MLIGSTYYTRTIFINYKIFDILIGNHFKP